MSHHFREPGSATEIEMARQPVGPENLMKHRYGQRLLCEAVQAWETGKGYHRSLTVLFQLHSGEHHEKKK
jgi:hypothetical protein